jgi:O-antigen/teichoic acid export membrane protein
MGSAVVHTVVSIGAATALGEDAAAAIAAALPLSVWLVATWALKTAGGVTEMRYPPSRRIALTILRRGLPLMVPGLTESASAFVIRLLGAGVLGLATLGQVNAAQALSGFVLVTVMSAMNQDFLPRLGEASGSPERLYALASEQLLVTLQLSTPILLLLCAVSEEATQLLFSDEFVLTAELVRIMALVVVVQIATWPLHTLQTILALPSQQLLGSMANLGATAILVTVMFWNVSAFEFAGILICGELLRFAAQYVLLWRTVGIRYRRAEWFPIGLALMVLVGFDLLPADWDAIAKPTEAVLGAVWGAFALRHYRLHR